MPTYFWIILAVLIGLYFYARQKRKEKRAYYNRVMLALQEKGVPSKKLLDSLDPFESGRMLSGFYKKKVSADEAADRLIEKYHRTAKSR